MVNLCIVHPIDGVSFSSLALICQYLPSPVTVARSVQNGVPKGVNENADPDVRTDHLAAISRLHPPGAKEPKATQSGAQG